MNIIEMIITILIFNAFISFIGGLLFFIACLKQHENFPYLFIYVFFFLATIIYIFQFLNDIYVFFAILFYDFAAISVFISALIDYKKIHQKSKKSNYLVQNTLIAIILIDIIIIPMQIFMIILLLISALILLRIYLTNKEINRLLIFICVIIASAGSIIQTFIPLEGLDALFLDSFITTVWITIFLVNGIIVFLEIEIKKNLQMKNNLKDLYSHNVGNTLQSIYLTFDLVKNKINLEVEFIELFNLLEKKINEASEFVREIRKL
ncbi:MAG: hypothetical protein GF353_29405 [Candidatus Lokiarchaeota archaeon]|nr:hypothetical protein [Candidatus Lokiarchaeota archaeon]